MSTMPNYIGHYRIISEIGRGGMGVVYKAEEESLNRLVAVKVLGEHLTQDASYVKRFQREAQAAARLNHPNIVHIYFIGEDAGRHYFAMEYIDGQSLQEVLRIKERLPKDEAVRLMLQAASGLATAHAAGIIHRDIKPANLMVTGQGQLKITDFGLARPTEAATRLTATGMLMGTPAYLAPEQCLDQEIDQRADIFSLGVTFFELLTGHRPFEANSPVALLKVISDAVPPDLSLVSKDPDDPLRRILDRMLAKDPAQRYQDCTELMTALSRHLETPSQQALSGLSAVPPPPVPPHTPSREALAQTPTIHVDSAAGPPPPPMSPPRPPEPAVPQRSRSGHSHKGTWIVLGAVLLVAVLATAGAVAWHAGIVHNMVALMRGHRASATATNAVQPLPAPQPSAQPRTDIAATDQIAAPSNFADTSGVDVESERGGSRATIQRRSTTTGSGTTVSAPREPGRLAASEPAMTASTDARAVRTAQAQEASGIAVVAVGEPVIATAAGQYLASRLVKAGFQVLTERDFPSLDRVLSRTKGPSTGEIVNHLHGSARAAIVLRATYLGSRPLMYMGQTDQAFQSRLDVLCIDLDSGAELMPAWTKTIEYTRVRTDRTAAKSLRTVADRVIHALTGAHAAGP